MAATAVGGPYVDQDMGPGQVRLCGSIVTDASGVVASFRGKGFYAEHPSTGLYVVKLGSNPRLRARYRSLLCCSVGIICGDAKNYVLRVSSSTDVANATAPQITLSVMEDGDLVDPVSSSLCFDAVLATSTENT